MKNLFFVLICLTFSKISSANSGHPMNNFPASSHSSSKKAAVEPESQAPKNYTVHDYIRNYE